MAGRLDRRGVLRYTHIPTPLEHSTSPLYDITDATRRTHELALCDRCHTAWASGAHVWVPAGHTCSLRGGGRGWLTHETTIHNIFLIFCVFVYVDLFFIFSFFSCLDFSDFVFVFLCVVIFSFFPTEPPNHSRGMCAFPFLVCRVGVCICLFCSAVPSLRMHVLSASWFWTVIPLTHAVLVPLHCFLSVCRSCCVWRCLCCACVEAACSRRRQRRISSARALGRGENGGRWA